MFPDNDEDYVPEGESESESDGEGAESKAVVVNEMPKHNENKLLSLSFDSPAMGTRSKKKRFQLALQ